MIFRWFESLIDIFREAPDRAPPKGVVRFYAYYLGQVWKIFVATLVVGLAVALIEVALFDFLGRVVDMAQKTPAAVFFQTHWRTLAWMAFVVVLLRPLAMALHDLLVKALVL